jgi:hypothetical protein
MTHPLVDAPQSEASVGLSPAGGYASKFARDFSYRYENKELVSFAFASSQVQGSTDPSGMRFLTQATVRIEKLRVMTDLVTADEVVGRLVSIQPGALPAPPLPMLPDGSRFWNLRIKGRPIEPRPHPLIMQSDGTKKSIDELCRRYPEPKGHKPLMNPHDSRPARPGTNPAPTVVSLLDDAVLPAEDQRQMAFSSEELSPEQTADKIQGAIVHPGWRIVIPGFGKVILGEYVVFEDHRVLIMVKLIMGSPQRGTLALASVEGDGRPY